MDLPILHTERLTLRPQAEEDFEALAAIITAPSVLRWWGTPKDRDELREDLLHDGNAYTLLARGEIVGWLGVSEEPTLDYRFAALDIALAADHQDRGLGSEALRRVLRWLIEDRGHHHATIDPAASNARAIRAYAAVGFRPVGILRQGERGPDGSWHDTLLMDLVAEELVEPRGGA